MQTEFEQLMLNEKAFVLKNLNEKLDNYKRMNEFTATSETNSECVQIQTRLNYLNVSPATLIVDLISVFEGLFNKQDFVPILDFFYMLKSDAFLADAFQLAICYAKCDIELSLEDLKMRKRSDENSYIYENDHKYTSFLKKIFTRVFRSRFSDSYSTILPKEAVKQVKKFLGQCLFDKYFEISLKKGRKFFEQEDETEQENTQ
jgi:hypothetical protein